jgi:carbon-monoxide dehydrogenase large subunit
MAVKGSILGNEVLRREDNALLQGHDRYTDDLEVTGAGHVHFVRSTVAFGTIESIDRSSAEGMPGVLAVYTSENMALPPFAGFPMIPEELARPPLASGTVRFVGDIVAAIVAETRAQAVDAAEAMTVDIDPLDPVVTPAAALADGAPLLFPDHGSNVAFAHAIGQEEGDPDPLEGADHVAEVTMESQRLAGVPIEPNGALIIPDGDSITCYFPTQTPISLWEPVAGLLGMAQENVRIVAPAVGGGFGPKSGLYAEYLITAQAARDLGRPVKWTEVRSENMVSMFQGRAMTMTAKLGLTSDGKFVGIDADVVADAGAYPGLGGILALFTGTMIQAVYDIPKVRFNAVTAVTNTTPIGAYRGAGRPEATQLVERVIDVAADEMGLDPAELRRKNFLQPGNFPLTTKGGANYDSGEYERALDAVLEAAGYAELRAEQARRRESGDGKQLGIGLSSYVEITAPAGLHVEYGKVVVNPDGTADAYVGTSAHGQGHVTAFSMIVSDMLGIPMDKISLIQSDTDQIPRGTGTLGSRSLQTAGSAVHVASETVLEKAKELAGHLLEADASDIVKGDDGLHVAGVPANSLSWAELAQAAADDSKRPEGMEPGLSHELDFDGSDATFPFGSHVAVVEVDTETGDVTLLRHVAVDDCGIILNPMLVRGQQHGGIAQGAAQALYEVMSIDEAGNPVTANLADYSIPSAAELPSFETSNTETASPRNPIGAKGIGESGTIGSTPAIHNAVVDAVSHLGVRHIDMPLTSMAVWKAIQAAG